MSSSQHRRWDFEATSADDGGGGGDEQVHPAEAYREMSSSQQSKWDYAIQSPDDDDDDGEGGGDAYVYEKEAYGGLYVMSNENMTNCYKRCEYFFKVYACIHFKLLIAYWIMAGYLGNCVQSVEGAYEKGLVCLFDLVYKEKILKLSDGDRNMIEFAGSSTNANCKHPGFCFDEIIFREMIFFEGMSCVRKVVLSKDKMLSMNGRACVRKVLLTEYEEEMLSVYGRASVPVFDCIQNRRRDKYVAVFNPSPDSLKALLENVKNPSMLLLRGFDELSLPIDSFPLDRLERLTFLEISGSSRLTAIPENTISRLDCLLYLNLSDLPIQEFPSNFFSSFCMLLLF